MLQKEYFEYTEMRKHKQPLGGTPPCPPCSDGTGFELE